MRINKSNLCPALIANMGTDAYNVYIIRVKYGVRRLIPRECFNFQGYPKSFKLTRNINHSLCN